jgi:hypothetical protein
VLSEGISRFEVEIAELAPRQPDYQLFDDLPGASPSFAPRLLVAFGENRDRFPTALSLQKSSGIAPVMGRSGNKAWVHWRYGCNKFVRQTFVEWAAQTIPRSFWAKAFYESHRARGARHQAALRALAFKWIRVLHRCWLDRVPYDESRYLMALQKRGAPCSSTPLKAPDSPCGAPQGVSWAATTLQSHRDNVDVLGVCCQGLEILGVCCDDGPSGLSRCNHERIYGRAAAGKPT